MALPISLLERKNVRDSADRKRTSLGCQEFKVALARDVVEWLTCI